MPFAHLTVTVRSRINTATIILFYLTCVFVGTLSLLGDPAPTIVAALGYGVWTVSFGVSYVTCGLGAFFAHICHRSRTESQILLLLSSTVVAHGAILIFDRAYMTGVFVISVAALLVNISATTAGVTFTRGQVLAAIEER